jgi:hypothetical protein
VAVRLDGGPVVANLHATNARGGSRTRNRAGAGWAYRLAGAETVVLAGDQRGHGPVGRARAPGRVHERGPGVDHVGARRRDRPTTSGRPTGETEAALSDHAPVEVEVR